MKWMYDHITDTLYIFDEGVPPMSHSQGKPSVDIVTDIRGAIVGLTIYEASIFLGVPKKKLLGVNEAGDPLG